MSSVLVNDIKAVVKLYQPVSVKHLTNQFIFCEDVPLQKVLLKQIELLRFFCGSSRALLSSRSAVRCTRRRLLHVCLAVRCFYCVQFRVCLAFRRAMHSCAAHSRLTNPVRLLLLAVDPPAVADLCGRTALVICCHPLPHLPDEIVLIMNFPGCSSCRSG